MAGVVSLSLIAGLLIARVYSTVTNNDPSIVEALGLIRYYCFGNSRIVNGARATSGLVISDEGIGE
jgi:hypothetical protein